MKKGFIFLVLFLTLFSFSCNNKTIISMKNFRNKPVVDLSSLCREKYDFLLILDKGNFLSGLDFYKYNLNPFNDSVWLGQKILFVRNGNVIKEVDIEYYISEPKKNFNYISFFKNSYVSEEIIYREASDSVFYVDHKEVLDNNSFCCYLR